MTSALKEPEPPTTSLTTPTPIAPPAATSHALRNAALGLVALGAIAALVVVGVLPRMARTASRTATQEELNAPRRVIVTHVRTAPVDVDLSLPATVAPLVSTTLYARTNGFVKAVHADLGDHVRVGQKLVDIEAAENTDDTRVLQARLDEAKANAVLADENAARLERLAADGTVSKAQADDARARANSAKAAVETGAASLARQGTLTGYQTVTAPFSGVITKRSVERGTLVTSGSGGSVTPLFELADLEHLRAWVDVPQSLAPFVKIGQPVALTVQGMTTSVTGKVVRTAGSLDAGSRTLRTEVQLPEKSSVLSGAFVRAKLQMHRTAPPVVIPASALVVRKDGPQVAVVKDHVVHLVTVEIGRDLGKEIELLHGLTGDEVVVVNAPDDLAEGAPVREGQREPEAGAKPAAQPAAQPASPAGTKP